MAEITKELGRIPVSRGDYQTTVEYYKDNIVQYKRSSYQVLSESPIVGVPPTNDKNVVNPGWTLFAGTLDAQDVVNQIKEQETKSIQAVADREAEILAKSDASNISYTDNQNLGSNNVQGALDSTSKQLHLLKQQVGKSSFSEPDTAFNIDLSTYGYVSVDNGNFINVGQEGAWKFSDYLLIKPGSHLRNETIYAPYNTVAVVAFYDVNRNYIKQGSTSSFTVDGINVPNNAVYVVFCGRVNDAAELLKPHGELIENLSDSISNIKKGHILVDKDVLLQAGEKIYTETLSKILPEGQLLHICIDGLESLYPDLTIMLVSSSGVVDSYISYLIGYNYKDFYFRSTPKLKYIQIRRGNTSETPIHLYIANELSIKETTIKEVREVHKLDEVNNLLKINSYNPTIELETGRYVSYLNNTIQYSSLSYMGCTNPLYIKEGSKIEINLYDSNNGKPYPEAISSSICLIAQTLEDKDTLIKPILIGKNNQAQYECVISVSGYYVLSYKSDAGVYIRITESSAFENVYKTINSIDIPDVPEITNASDAIVETVSDTHIVVDNVSANSHTQIIKVHPINEYQKKGTIESIQNGVTITYNTDDQSYLLNGTTTEVGNITLSSGFPIDIEEGDLVRVMYQIDSGSITFSDNNAYLLFGLFNSNFSKFLSRPKYSKDSVVEKVIGPMIPFDANGYKFVIQCLEAPGITFNNVIIRFMVSRLHHLDDSWVPCPKNDITKWYVKVNEEIHYPNIEGNIEIKSNNPTVDITSFKDCFNMDFTYQANPNSLLSGKQWKGKTWMAFGTSITDNTYIDTNTGQITGKYSEYLEKLSGMKQINKGIAGGTIATGGTYHASGNILRKIKETDFTGVDLVTLEGFVNDFACAVPIGEIGDTTGQDSMIGAIYDAVTYIQSNSSARVILITEHTGMANSQVDYTFLRKNSIGLLQKDYNDAIKTVGVLCDVPVIDAGSKAQINQFHPEYFMDHLHHSYLGGKQFARTIWEELKTIYPLEK